MDLVRDGQEKCWTSMLCEEGEYAGLLDCLLEFAKLYALFFQNLALLPTLSILLKNIFSLVLLFR